MRELIHPRWSATYAARAYATHTHKVLSVFNTIGNTLLYFVGANIETVVNVQD